MKDIYGCEKESIYGVYWDIDGNKSKRCPLREITIEGVQFLDAYEFFEKSLLPYSGGWLDQANPYIEAMMLLDNQYARLKMELEKNNNRGVRDGGKR